ncbi:MAG TPA: helix-turn-helix domain-containing protein [Thermomicrobiales bacterium]|jgi:DNA-binding transcriptional ArsR family regulator
MPHDDPQDVFVISDPAVLKVVAHPLRLRILEDLRAHAGAPRSVKEIATALGSSQTKLYYHVNLLVDRGLIRVAETRLVSGIVERRYRVTAYRLSFDRSLLATDQAGDDGLEVWLSLVLDEARSEIRNAVAAGLIDLDRSADDDMGPRRLVLGRKWFSLTPAELAEFNRRYDDLMASFGSCVPSDQVANARPEATLYELLLGFYPTVPPGPESGAGSPTPS